jgi:transposase
VPAGAPVISCYEAGRDGFWLHRYLVVHGLANHVVDSSSIEVNRRARRAKTDRLDLVGLLSLLARYSQGDHRVWRVVRVPTVVEEDARQLHRTWETLQQDRTRLMNRLNEPDPDTPTGRFVQQLQTVRAVGPMSAWVLTTEIFGWREIRNGRQLGALVGLAPAPYHSGETQRDQGITRAGNAHVRRAVVQLAWGWVRYQPCRATVILTPSRH